MYKLFYEDTNFNEDITAWDVGNVVDMGEMFSKARAFNQPIGDWDVSKVTNIKVKCFAMLNHSTNH